MQTFQHQLHGLIFDLDGVIVDSEPIQEEVAKLTCETFDILIDESIWPTFKGKTDRDMFGTIIDHHSNGSLTIQQLVETKDRLLAERTPHNLPPVPGAISFIEEWHSAFLKLGLSTSSKREYQLSIFNHWNLHDYFDSVTCGDDITNGKPHPEPYLRTLQKINLPGHSCLVIEDSQNGIRSAKSAGCLVAGITTSFSAEELTASGADFTFNQFERLPRILGLTKNRNQSLS